MNAASLAVSYRKHGSLKNANFRLFFMKYCSLSCILKYPCTSSQIVMPQSWPRFKSFSCSVQDSRVKKLLVGLTFSRVLKWNSFGSCSNGSKRRRHDPKLFGSHFWRSTINSVNEGVWGQFHQHDYEQLLCPRMLWHSTSISQTILIPTLQVHSN